MKTSTAPHIEIANRIIETFERVTGDKAANYPNAKLMDFQAWIRDELDEQFRQRQAAKAR